MLFCRGRAGRKRAADSSLLSNTDVGVGVVVVEDHFFEGVRVGVDIFFALVVVVDLLLLFGFSVVVDEPSGGNASSSPFALSGVVVVVGDDIMNWEEECAFACGCIIP